MNGKPIIVEEAYNASIGKVWRALTDGEEMKQWYFDIKGFKPEVGFEFRFYGGSEQQQYLHLCKITEVIKEHKLAYTWRYEGYEGVTVVSFELIGENGRTHLTLTHKGVDTFPQGNPDFSRESFTAGWTDIVKNSLKNYVEKS